jgi:glycosyltransferase involved in cell wall biosynthesis
MSGGRPVRVSFFIDRLTRAGTETQLLALIRALDRRRVEPSLALLDGTDGESRALEPGDCPMIRLGLRTWKQPLKLARAARRLAGFWRRQRVDVVQTYFLDSTYLGVPLARACGIRRVLRVRNNVGHWLTPAHRSLGRVVGRLVHHTLTNSEPGRAALHRAERGARLKYVVLENGVDLDHFARVPPPRSRGGVVTVGALANLRPVKGIDVLIRAAARVPGARFVVAGDGPDREDLQRLIAAEGLAGRFELLGPVADVPSFLAKVDIGVVPSRAEGMSNAVLEFMAAGRPVVATDVGANAQLLGGCGRVVPPEDAAALAAALRSVVGDADLGERLGAAGRRRAETRYSRSAMRERFERFYASLVGRAA